MKSSKKTVLLVSLGIMLAPVISIAENGAGDVMCNAFQGVNKAPLNISDLKVSEKEDPEATAIVTRVVNYSGIPQDFVVREANVENATAYYSGRRRYIFYSKKFLIDLKNSTKTDWAATSVLAHEIGHHIAGHTLAAARRIQQEVDADYFSGFILCNMGASSDDATAAMKRFAPLEARDGYPSRGDRISSVTNGWNKAFSLRTGRMSEPPLTDAQPPARITNGFHPPKPIEPPNRIEPPDGRAGNPNFRRLFVPQGNLNASQTISKLQLTISGSSSNSYGQKLKIKLLANGEEIAARSIVIGDSTDVLLRPQYPVDSRVKLCVAFGSAIPDEPIGILGSLLGEGVRWSFDASASAIDSDGNAILKIPIQRVNLGGGFSEISKKVYFGR